MLPAVPRSPPGWFRPSLFHPTSFLLCQGCWHCPRTTSASISSAANVPPLLAASEAASRRPARETSGPRTPWKERRPRAPAKQASKSESRSLSHRRYVAEVWGLAGANATIARLSGSTGHCRQRGRCCDARCENFRRAAADQIMPILMAAGQETRRPRCKAARAGRDSAAPARGRSIGIMEVWRPRESHGFRE